MLDLHVPPFIWMDVRSYKATETPGFGIMALKSEIFGSCKTLLLASQPKCLRARQCRAPQKVTVEHHKKCRAPQKVSSTTKSVEHHKKCRAVNRPIS